MSAENFAKSTRRTDLLKKAFLLFIIFLAFFLSSWPAKAAENKVLKNSNPEFGISFPPLADARGFQVTKKYLKDLGVRLIRFDIHWKFREPQQDSFKWGPQDRRMEFLLQNGFIPVLTFHADAPAWIRKGIASNKQNKKSVALNKLANKRFADFVGRFIQRYQKKYPQLLQYFQYGNEWLSQYWYAGNSADFVQTQNLFYSTIKKELPEAKVILGGLASGQIHAIAVLDGFIESFYDGEGNRIDKKSLANLLKRQRAGIEAGKVDESVIQRLENILEKSKFDWVDFHVYDDFRLWPACFKALKNRLKNRKALKFVVTEFGGPHPVREAEISEEKYVELVDNYLHTLNKLDIEFALFFSLIRKPGVVHFRSGLLGFEYGKIIQYPAYKAFKRFMTPR